MAITVVRPLPQSTLDRLLTAVAEGYHLSPVETVQAAKFLENSNAARAVRYDFDQN